MLKQTPFHLLWRYSYLRKPSNLTFTFSQSFIRNSGSQAMSTSTSSTTETVVNGSSSPTVPPTLFIEVLQDLARRAEGSNRSWARLPLPATFLVEEPSITFQQIDVRDTGLECNSSEIHLFGVTKAGRSILARVTGFEHYFYYPAPVGFSEEDEEPLCDWLNTSLQSSSPIVRKIELEDQSPDPDAPSLPFLKISLADHRSIHRVKARVFTSGNCFYRGLFSSIEATYESDVPYFLRFMIDNQINAMTWLRIEPRKYESVPERDKISNCQIEIKVGKENLLVCDTVNDRLKFPPLRVLSFDIETHVPSSGKFCDGRRDSVIQIGNMVSILGQETPIIRNVFTFGTCSPIEGSQVLSFHRETDMLCAWRKFFLEVDPDIIIGYNLTKFDIPYLLTRARRLGLRNFPYLGRVKTLPQLLPDQRNTSSCPGYEGRVLLDLLPHIREHHPGLPGKGAYKLNSVSAHFLGDQKEDIHYSDIPALQSGGPDTRRSIAVYCLKDTYLPLLLFSKLKCFETEVKEARDAYVPYNAMRTARPLKALAKRCIDAFERQYIIRDPLPTEETETS